MVCRILNIILGACAIVFVAAGCIPDGIKDKVDEQMSEAQQMLADMEFKKALAGIEMHRLRTGDYPISITEIQYLSVMDSSIYTSVEYHKLDSGYELNLTEEYMNLFGGEKRIAKYPPDFWKGLGCVKSNLR